MSDNHIDISSAFQSDVTSDSKPGQLINQEILIIGITGRKRSGKDTIGKYLIETYGFTRVAYADALKEACKEIFGFSDEQVYGDELKEVVDDYWGHSPREIMQKVGTELFREHLPTVCKNITNNIWIRSVERKIQSLLKSGHTRFVITDVRFPNELEFINKMNGKVWKVSRHSTASTTTSACSSSISGSTEIETPVVAVHASEAMIDDFECDHEFLNNATRKDLFDKVDEEISSLIVR